MSEKVKIKYIAYSQKSQPALNHIRREVSQFDVEERTGMFEQPAQTLENAYSFLNQFATAFNSTGYMKNQYKYANRIRVVKDGAAVWLESVGVVTGQVYKICGFQTINQ